jgi:hypothetical protein
MFFYKFSINFKNYFFFFFTIEIKEIPPEIEEVNLFTDIKVPPIVFLIKEPVPW